MARDAAPAPAGGAPGGDAQLQDYLRLAAGRRREVVRVGPFTATFARGSDHPFLNYAIPDDDAQPSAADVATLVGAYTGRTLIPRLEYLPSVAPAVEPALLAGGFVVEARLPLLACRRAALREVAAPAGFRVRAPADAELLDMARVQHGAFGEGPPTAADAAHLADSVSAGGLVAVAAGERSGAIVGAGAATPLAMGVTELVGIAVAPAFRRRGIGAAITAELARQAFAGGAAMVFLTPGDDGAERVYLRAGFTPATRMLHMRRP